MTGDEKDAGGRSAGLSLVTYHLSLVFYRRGGTPDPFFFTLGLREPRGSVCLGLGGRFLRASRLSRLRSARSLIFRVSMNVPSVLKLRLLQKSVAFHQLHFSVAWKADRQFRILAFALAL